MIPAEIVQFFLIFLFLTLWLMERGKREVARRDGELLVGRLAEEQAKTAHPVEVIGVLWYNSYPFREASQ